MCTLFRTRLKYYYEYYIDVHVIVSNEDNGLKVATKYWEGMKVVCVL